VYDYETGNRVSFLIAFLMSKILPKTLTSNFIFSFYLLGLSLNDLTVE
jgi:hypothetical protein